MVVLVKLERQDGLLEGEASQRYCVAYYTRYDSEFLELAPEAKLLGDFFSS
jgi:hypothetical protein